MKSRVLSLCLVLCIIAGFIAPMAAYADGAQPMTVSALPKYYRSKEITSVKWQNWSNWCWIFSGISALETNLIHKGLANTSVDLSEKHLAYWTSHKGYTDPKGIMKDYRDVTTDYADSDIEKIKSREKERNDRTYNYVAVIPDHWFCAVGGTIWKFAQCMSWAGTASEQTAPGDDCYIYKFDSNGRALPELNTVRMPSLTPESSTVQLNRSIQIPAHEDNYDEVKRLILEYGSATIFYNSTAAYYNTAEGAGKGSYYNPNATATSHVVQIVGWDDDYSKDNFLHKPPKNGAWIIKNSSGVNAQKTDKGFNYISYCEPEISGLLVDTHCFSFYDATIKGQPDFYDNNYTYSYFSSNTKKAYGMANIFTAKITGNTGFEKLKAVSFYAMDDGMSYTLRIFKNVADGRPADGTLVYEQPLNFANRGYYRLPLQDMYWLDKNAGVLSDGERFSVVFTSGSKFTIPYQSARNGSDELYNDPGQQYITRVYRSTTNLIYHGRRFRYHEAAGQSYEFTAASDSSAKLMNKANLLISAFTNNVFAKKVTFKAGNGERDAVKNVETGSKVAAPEAPRRTGYIFGGWYKNKACSSGQEWNFNKDVVKADIVLYAKWTPIELRLASGAGFEIVKIMRWQGMDSAKTGEPRNRGYDPTKVSVTLKVNGTSDAAEVLNALKAARYERAQKSGFAPLSMSQINNTLTLGYVGSNGKTVPVMKASVAKQGAAVTVQLTSMAPGCVRLTLSEKEYAFITPGDINLDGEMNANDWGCIMRCIVEASSAFDVTDYKNFMLNGRRLDMWTLLADMTSEKTAGQRKTLVDANDWSTIMYLTAEAWK